MGMQTGANAGKDWIWRYPEEEWEEDCLQATHISGFKKVKIWGAMRWGKLSIGIIFKEKEGDGKLNSQEYCEEIMDGELFNFWQSSAEELGCVLVMEDGAPYHQGICTQRRKEYGLEGWGPKTWPTSSSDLNPIENLWHVLRTQVRKRRPKALRKEDLIVVLKEEWSKMDINLVNKLCESMPYRLRAVINAGGKSTKF